MRRRTTALAVLLLLLLGGALALLLLPHSEESTTAPRSLPRTDAAQHLTGPPSAASGFTGEAEGSGPTALTVQQLTSSRALDLSPGTPRVLELLVGNERGREAVLLSSLAVEWGDAAPGCLRGNLAVEQYDVRSHAARYRLPAGGSAVVRLRIELLDTATNQDACKGLAFPLTFRAQGRTA